jgi:hypothetical protein
MLNYINNNYGNRPSVNEGEKMELEFLRKEVQWLSNQLTEIKLNTPKQGGTSTASEGGGSSSSEESDEEVMDLPESKPMAKPKAAGPRMSVSAEVFGKFNRQENYKAPEYPKDEAQVKAITEKMECNFLFNSLNPIEKKKIILAVQ